MYVHYCEVMILCRISVEEADKIRRGKALAMLSSFNEWTKTYNACTGLGLRASAAVAAATFESLERQFLGDENSNNA